MLWGPTGAEQLEQVGRQTHQFPLAANIVQTTQAEAPEAALLLDLSEDRFDDRLAHFVNGSSSLGAQFVPHCFLDRGLVRRRPAHRGDDFFVLHASRGDMQIDARYAFGGYIGFTPIARIRAGRVRFAAQVLFHLT